MRIFSKTVLAADNFAGRSWERASPLFQSGNEVSVLGI